MRTTVPDHPIERTPDTVAFTGVRTRWPAALVILILALAAIFDALSGNPIHAILLLGAAAIFGVTLMVQQDNKPPLQAGDPASSVLNRVEYGDRT